VSRDTVVIDSSVCVAIFKGEGETASLTESTYSYDRRVMSAATWLESAMVCEGSAKQGGAARLDRILASLAVEILPVSIAQARLAFEAFKRFGKGRGAKASLNYGDCFVYALAKELGAPVLFKGDDFTQTDLERA
jgi:ribonuclease VapC